MSSACSWSLQLLHNPPGGIAFIPFRTDAMSPSIPLDLRRAAQASASPVLGAPATPTAWQAPHEAAYCGGGSPANTAGTAANAAAAKPGIAKARQNNAVFIMNPSDVPLRRLANADTRHDYCSALLFGENEVDTLPIAPSFSSPNPPKRHPPHWLQSMRLKLMIVPSALVVRAWHYRRSV